VSAVCATRQPIEPRFYWLSLTDLDCAAGGIFRLESLNPAIGHPGESCVNFVTHLPGRNHPFLAQGDDAILQAYRADFLRLFGAPFEPAWTHVVRLPLYSPVFTRGFRNPPVRSATWRNVWFAGNYRTHPSVASTGTALDSGLEAACAALAELGRGSELAASAAAYRPPASWPR